MTLAGSLRVHAPVSFATLAVALLSACAPMAVASPSATLHEAIPAPGDFHLISDPRAAPLNLLLRYFGEDGEPSLASDEFVAGQLVVVDRSSLPGARGVITNGESCDGRFELVAGTEVDILLLLRGSPCGIEVLGSHPSGAIRHGDEAAVLFARVPLGSRVSVRPIATTSMVEAQIVAADESGAVTVGPLPPGSYEVSLLEGSEVRGTQEVQLLPGDGQVVSFLDSP